MNYSDGHEAELGDTVEISDGIVGTVVVLVKEGIAADGFAPEEWLYLKEGILIQSPTIGLVHYPERFKDQLSLGIRAPNAHR